MKEWTLHIIFAFLFVLVFSNLLLWSKDSFYDYSLKPTEFYKPYFRLAFTIIIGGLWASTQGFLALRHWRR